MRSSESIQREDQQYRLNVLVLLKVVIHITGYALMFQFVSYEAAVAAFLLIDADDLFKRMVY